MLMKPRMKCFSQRDIFWIFRVDILRELDVYKRQSCSHIVSKYFNNWLTEFSFSGSSQTTNTSQMCIRDRTGSSFLLHKLCRRCLHNYQPNICIPYNLDIVLLLFCVMLSPCIFVLFILPSDFALGQKRITDQLI